MVGSAQPGGADASVLLVFIDGLGLGKPDAAVNPLYRGACPFLVELLEDQARPIDAQLGLPGRPQSATGQAAIFTGKNASAHMGRHVEGLPGPKLKELVREHNVYRRLQALDARATFANAYYIDDQEDIRRHRRPSVSTVAALQAFGRVRDRRDLEANRAVYQDLTRTVLQERGYPGPLIRPSEAAEHLAAVAVDYDFTLFEYFQTDLMAHRGSEEDIQRVLAEVNDFLATLLPAWLRGDRVFLLVSDHGNIEDATSRSHSMNPVPWVVTGSSADGLHEVTDLIGITPALVTRAAALAGAGTGG